MAESLGRGVLQLEIGPGVQTFEWKTSQINSMESHFKMGISKMLSEDMLGTRLLTYALFVGRVKQEPTLTVKKVEDWLDRFKGSLPELMGDVFNAIAAAIPGENMTEDEEEVENAPLGVAA
jgi:hypothetical protein